MSRREAEAVETIEREGFVGKLYQDEDPSSPKDWDQLGTLVTWHREYCFDEDGKKVFGSPQDFLERAGAEGWIYLPVGMIDHSGISLYVGSGAHVMDYGGWDSGQIGFIYTTPKRIEEMGTPRDGVEACLAGEVETWDQFVTGDIYGYVIEGPSDGDSDSHRDSCWGFYGFEEAKREMVEMLDAAIRFEKKEEAKIERIMRI